MENAIFGLNFYLKGRKWSETFSYSSKTNRIFFSFILLKLVSCPFLSKLSFDYFIKIGKRSRESLEQMPFLFAIHFYCVVFFVTFDLILSACCSDVLSMRWFFCIKYDEIGLRSDKPLLFCSSVVFVILFALTLCLKAKLKRMFGPDINILYVKAHRKKKSVLFVSDEDLMCLATRQMNRTDKKALFDFLFLVRPVCFPLSFFYDKLTGMMWINKNNIIMCMQETHTHRWNYD